MYHEYQFIAVDKIDSVIIIVAAGPINQDMMEELQRVSGCKICHYVSIWRDIHSAIERNSHELGGQAQIELTGLGSMLLDAPAMPQPSMGNAGLSTAGGRNNVGVSIGPSTASSIFKPGESIRLGQAPRTAIVPKSRILNATNLSQVLSPFSQINANSPTEPNIPEAPSSSVPPSPRLTAFLKLQGNTGAGSPSASSPSLQAFARSSERMSSLQASASNGSMGAVPGLSSPGTRPAPPAPQVPRGSGTSFTPKVSVAAAAACQFRNRRHTGRSEQSGPAEAALEFHQYPQESTHAIKDLGTL